MSTRSRAIQDQRVASTTAPKAQYSLIWGHRQPVMACLPAHPTETDLDGLRRHLQVIGTLDLKSYTADPTDVAFPVFPMKKEQAGPVNDPARHKPVHGHVFVHVRDHGKCEPEFEVVRNDAGAEALGAGEPTEAHLPMGFTMTHLRAVRAVIGPDFEILNDDDYYRRDGAHEVFKIVRRTSPKPVPPMGTSGCAWTCCPDPDHRPEDAWSKPCTWDLLSTTGPCPVHAPVMAYANSLN